ncbi:HlyD family secretion protein [Aquella oligotrophica]|uniref:Multidrug resistance protein MdtA-like barrel-sandwich hybrid domain-containing protein n=1 Tax=Aquella oligotrophica TaxID=2067065 RepID=A0A2I7N5Y4_9NEIS|nr:HlyD family secretion protein [Aquella oligotrophica]AUR51883.1 hypothetical protein CUN60_06090 [Aquella oligotrophica]
MIFRNRIKYFVLGGALCLIVTYSLAVFFHYKRLYPSTNNAYVNAGIVNVTSEVNGYIESLVVSDGVKVSEGDLLFTIRPDKLNYYLEEANNNYLGQISQVKKIDSQIFAQKAQIIKDRATYKFTLDKVKRYKLLFDNETISEQSYQNSIVENEGARTQLDIDNRLLQQYIDEKNSAIQKQKALYSQVKINNSTLNQSKYTAPVNGYIVDLGTLNSGEYVTTGKPLFSIVNDNNWWVDANFKEDQLNSIRIGQKAEIELDMYKHIYSGQVVSISYASGSTFAILPTQNATGNWIKVPQRFTVKIKLNNDLNFPLRVGASSKVTVLPEK